MQGASCFDVISKSVVVKYVVTKEDRKQEVTLPVVK